MEKMEKLEIQEEPSLFKKLLPIKSHFFLLYGGSSTVVPFIFIYAKQLGITADVLGYITALFWCSTVLSRLVLGGLADHFQKHKLVLLSMVVLSIISGLGLNFIPLPMQATTNSTTNTSLVCLQNSSFLIEFETDICESGLPNCAEGCVISCSLCETSSANCTDGDAPYFDEHGYMDSCIGDITSKCRGSNIKKGCSENRIEDSVDAGSTTVQNAPLQLGLFSVFTIVFFICQTTIAFLSDTACWTAVGGRTTLYGRQRMWGTIGWGIFSALAGYFNHLATGTSDIVNYSPGFYIMTALTATDLVVIWKLQLKISRSAENVLKDVGKLLLKPRIMLFILQVTTVGMVRGLFNAYLFWYLESIGGNQVLFGSVTAMQGFLGELPFFFFSGWIIAKIGHLNVFTLSFVAHGVRFLAYSFLTNPWWGLLIEILQGPAFGSFYAAASSYAKIVAPEGTEATVQGISQAAIEGVGAASGSLLGGYAVHNFGGRSTFFWTGIFSVIFGMISCVTNGILACNLI